MTELPISLAGHLWDAPSAEEDVIERAKRDPEAFAMLYRRHYAPIAGYILRRLGDVHAAEDLAAEVFLTAMRSLPRFRYRGVPLRAWLFRIATNAVNREVRRNRKRWAQSSLEVDGYEPTVGDAGDRFESERARKALLSVSPKLQAVLALHYLEGMSVEEVASVLGCRIGTVKSRLSRAREALRDRLKKGR